MPPKNVFLRRPIVTRRSKASFIEEPTNIPVVESPHASPEPVPDKQPSSIGSLNTQHESPLLQASENTGKHIYSL